MKNLKHTPRPWSIEFTDKVENHLDGFISSTCRGLAWVYTEDVEQQANCHLIAAAPDMLEMLLENLQALKNLTGKDCYNSGHDICQCTACKTKRVIAKATNQKEVEND